MVWMKFFEFMPMPTPADKLAVGSFIPARLRDRIRTARVLWRSREPRIPPRGAVPPGHHFLKVNNGSGSNLRLQFPCAPRDEARLRPWLRNAFGFPPSIAWGEWWYSTIEPAVFVEQAIGGPERPDEWKFFVFNGVCRFLYHHQDRTTGTKKHTLYDREFNYLPVRIRDVEIGEVVSPPLEYGLMLEAAEAIAGPLTFARIDLYRTSTGELFLGEITLCPNNTIYWFSDPGFDEAMGSHWKLGAGPGPMDEKPRG
jgi:hypothetical protein